MKLNSFMNIARAWAERPDSLPMPTIPLRLEAMDVRELGRYIKSLEEKALALEIEQNHALPSLRY